VSQVGNAVTLRLPDDWIWDFWFAKEGDDVHVFHLKAPRSLGDPELRHHSATIGHSVSRDLRTWQVLPDALGRGAPGDFDDLATWTGSVLDHDGRWYMAYTGVSRANRGLVQRIGLASSDDLVSWSKHGLVSEADPRWYEKAGPGVAEESWRDPWLVWDRDSDRFHMIITARARHGPRDGRGVIGHAWSRDLLSWEAGPPLSRPGEFSNLEVAQLVHLGGAWRILFCTTQDGHSVARLGRSGVARECGTHYLTAAKKFGDYGLDQDCFLVGDAVGRHYGGRLLQHGDAWLFFAWLLYDERGVFVGELSDPMPVSTGTGGRLRVRIPAH
jgi:beta-fructofuranosidase